jgi:hypothetical protein
VEIASGGEDLRRAEQIATGRGPDEAAVERLQDAGDLVIAGEQLVGGGQFAQQSESEASSAAHAASG